MVQSELSSGSCGVDQRPHLLFDNLDCMPCRQNGIRRHYSDTKTKHNNLQCNSVCLCVFVRVCVRVCVGARASVSELSNVYDSQWPAMTPTG